MNDIVKEDIITILGEAILIIKSKEIYGLRDLSDHVIHNASIFQDEDSISTAVIIYALFKLFKSTSTIDKSIVLHLEKARLNLAAGDEEEYKKTIKRLFSLITQKDSKTRIYVKEVIEHALIKKGSRIFEHGISLGRVSDLLGISQWELRNYVGQTNISDSFDDFTDVRKRIKFTRKIFT
jgi:hypothetical protein